MRACYTCNGNSKNYLADNVLSNDEEEMGEVSSSIYEKKFAMLCYEEQVVDEDCHPDRVLQTEQ